MQTARWLALFVLLFDAPVLAGDATYTGLGIAMFGMPKYGDDFPHFDYVRPDAPKGGQLRMAAIGTFNNLNPFILGGVPAAASRLTFDTLMVASEDEPLTMYGLVAETIKIPDDRSWVEFTLRPQARFHDGSRITADDVIWTFNALKTQGHPFYSAYLKSVDRAEKLGDDSVRFVFAPGRNRELPLILGELPVLSEKFFESHDFGKTTLTPLLGSGPYRIATADPGHSLTLERVPGYWARDLAVNKGRYNFDRIRVEYYRNQDIALEGLKADAFDFRQETSVKSWVAGYDSTPLREGKLRKLELANEQPQGMTGYVFNTRRAIFRDRRVREAITHAFDFNWINKNLFSDKYTRITSFFSNSEFASKGPPTAADLDYLKAFAGDLPDDAFVKPFEVPATDGSGNIRSNLLTATRLLESAGWHLTGGRLVEDRSGSKFAFEILLNDADMERITQPFVQSLARLGIEASIRVVDSAQYVSRLNAFDYDMTIQSFRESLSPGNEQTDYWGSASADTAGGRNYAGIKDKRIDQLVEAIIASPDLDGLLARVRLLDRVLLWQYYVIPLGYNPSIWIAYWDRFGRPPLSPKYGRLFLDTWWRDPGKEAALVKN